MEKKTPIYERHVALGGKMVAFAGYLLPVQYEGSGILKEHKTVRNQAGLFDVSHMGEIILKGKAALQNVQNLVTNDCSNMSDGKVRYSPMCNPEGGIIDDLLIYRKNAECYMLVVNAANHKKDADWIKEQLKGEVDFADVSAQTAQIALQGPRSNDIIKKLAAATAIPQKYYSFVDKAEVGGFEVILSRTGYTGEDGFEIYCSNEAAPVLWDKLLAAGSEYGLLPCGLGARDTLRLEAAMPLYGQEMDDKVTPFEAGLAAYVKMEKADFIGQEALKEKQVPKYKRIGLKVLDRGIAREGAIVYADGLKAGVVTSGTQSPTLGYPIAMARALTEFAATGAIHSIDVRGRLLKAEVVELPFYKRKASK